MAKSPASKPENDEKANDGQRKAALDRTLVQIEKQYGKGAIMRLGSTTYR